MSPSWHHWGDIRKSVFYSLHRWLNIGRYSQPPPPHTNNKSINTETFLFFMKILPLTLYEYLLLYTYHTTFSHMLRSVLIHTKKHTSTHLHTQRIHWSTRLHQTHAQANTINFIITTTWIHKAKSEKNYKENKQRGCHWLKKLVCVTRARPRRLLDLL